MNIKRSNHDILRLDGRAHSLDAIKRALFDFSHLGMSLRMDGKNFVLFLRNWEVLPQDVEHTLLESILEHEIRIELENKYAGIRQVIVEQALCPLHTGALTFKISSL